MNSRLRLTLSGMWFIVSSSAVILPIFLPSIGTSLAGNPIAVATITMFIFSLPSSLLAIPLCYFLNAALGISSTPISLLYLNVLMMFLLGTVQWFWLVPRAFSETPIVQPLDLSEPTATSGLPEPEIAAAVDIYGFTPLERVLRSTDRG